MLKSLVPRVVYARRVRDQIRFRKKKTTAFWLESALRLGDKTDSVRKGGAMGSQLKKSRGSTASRFNLKTPVITTDKFGTSRDYPQKKIISVCLRGLLWLYMFLTNLAVIIRIGKKKHAPEICRLTVALPIISCPSKILKAFFFAQNWTVVTYHCMTITSRALTVKISIYFEGV